MFIWQERIRGIRNLYVVDMLLKDLSENTSKNSTEYTSKKFH